MIWPHSVAAVLVWLAISLLVPRAVVAQEGNLQNLSPAAIENVIASARPDAAVTMTIANREITILRASVLGRSSAERVGAAQELVAALSADGPRLPVTHRLIGTAAVISVGDRDLFAILPLDADQLLGETVDAKAGAAVAHLQQALDEIAEATRPRVLLWGLAQALLATFAFGVGLWALGRASRRASAAAWRTTERTLSRSSVGDEIVRGTDILRNIKRLITVVLFVVGLSLAYVWLTFVLRRFPYTRPWGESLRAVLLDRATSLAQSIVGALPDLFTVALIILVMRLVIRLVQLLFVAVEEQRLTLPWIYPETARPTRKLVTGLLWLFTLVICYPYLPGSETDAFKGVSVFVGLMFTLGSSGIVNQIMSGFTVTYSRALRHGDYVRVGDVEGTVSHMGTLSTKIETPRHEEVTIPNAVLISQVVTNFSRHGEVGVFVSTELTIGYDAPWRKVEALLLLAASLTPGVRLDPAPVVRQMGLEDFYVRYALLVCLEDPQRRVPILDRLHANIQDAFNEHGVQIMSPNYEADPAAPKIVPKEQWFVTPARDAGPASHT